MSNDWWSQTPSRYTSTPIHPTLSRSQSVSQSTRTRFAGDELDPEDSRAADAVKFLPSFASSQAGRVALGTSPTGGMSMSVGSPQGERRSPQGRLSGSVHESNSPRHITRARSLAQNAALSSSTANGPAPMDEDMPPTASLRDSVTETRVATVVASNELPTPPSLLPTKSTTTLYIFGPPPNILSTLQPYLTQFGPIASYRPGPEGSNWYIVEYTTPMGAAYALRRHGEVLGGQWMIGFKVAIGGAMEGIGSAPGEGDAQGSSSQVPPPTAGTPIRVQHKEILRPKVVQPVVAKAAVKSGNDYAWDEPEGSGGWTGWVSERLFGR
ncbi:hypothetical protein J005_02125 [Cryptococcus neoformans]|nr:hypothetical protein C344_02101 [Cryptococcus neoformans var. grubii AD1-7a]OXH35414.1 hypothetical protein J005_02125 [Cryptococcus neoformans var. grubii]